MMSKTITMICVVGIFMTSPVLAQRNGKFLIGGYADLYKTDIQEVGKKNQVGLELNYFINNRFTASGGAEFWSNQENAITLGARYYPSKRIFTRARGIFKNKTDISLGVGFYRPINEYFLIEGMADYYVKEGTAGLRIGITYILFYPAFN